jgi:C1A family cysteine protease
MMARREGYFGIYSQEVFHVPQFNSLQMKAAISLRPTTVVVNSNNNAFKFHDGKTALKDGTACPAKPDHQVLAIGYGVETDAMGNKTEYIIIKNSHGGTWGDKGYGKISTDQTLD